jgi:hypothetical protein
VYIPKPDGRQRPLAVAALEDKIVQRATDCGHACRIGPPCATGLLLNVPPPQPTDQRCKGCQSRSTACTLPSLPMLRRAHDLIETFEPGATPRYRPSAPTPGDQDRHVMIVPAPPSPRIALLVLSPQLARTRFGSPKQHARAPNHISIFTVRSIQRPVQCIARAHCVRQSTQAACRLPIRAVRPQLKSP